MTLPKTNRRGFLKAAGATVGAIPVLGATATTSATDMGGVGDSATTIRTLTLHQLMREVGGTIFCTTSLGHRDGFGRRAWSTGLYRKGENFDAREGTGFYVTELLPQPTDSVRERPPVFQAEVSWVVDGKNREEKVYVLGKGDVETLMRKLVGGS